MPVNGRWDLIRLLEV